MKRPLAALLAALTLALILTGCGDPAADNTPSASPPDGTQSAAPTADPSGEPTEEPVNDHVADYSLDLPDGFEPIGLEGLDAFWSREDGSNINLVTVEKEDAAVDFQTADADSMHAVIADQMGLLDLGVEITDRYFNRGGLCGLPAYWYCYDLRLEDGTSMTQLYVCVNADKLYVFTFTALEEELVPVFEACAENIQFIFE